MQIEKRTKTISSKKIALTAFASALLVGGKLALSFIPNVEVVTLFTIVFAYVLGYPAIIATFIFCTLDILLYPTTPDVIVSYYIYWDMLALIVALFRDKVSSTAFYTAIAVVGTLLFSILTTATYSIFYGVNFFAWYASGLLFFAIHLASSLVTVALAFKPLSNLLLRLKRDNVNL